MTDDEMIEALAECYCLSGADPDGNEPWRLAPRATREVARLRVEADESDDRVVELEAELGECYLKIGELGELLDSEEGQPPVYAEMSLEELIEHAGQKLGDKFKERLQESIDDEVSRAVYETESGEDL